MVVLGGVDFVSITASYDHIIELELSIHVY